MAYESEHKSAAELEREIELQRGRVEDTIDQIQQKLSPGQLVDELMAYTKGGGGEFLASLQRNVTANPLPVALLGVSLAWLMAKPAGAAAATPSATDRAWDDSINARRGYGVGAGDNYDDVDYPLVTISGSSMQRLGYVTDEGGNSLAEFADDAGRKFKAATDTAGRRASHFKDEAGNTFRGFSDSTGNQVQHFRDEAGNLLDEASGWASHTWQKAREKLHDARDAMASGTGSAGAKVGQASDALLGQAEKLNQTIIAQFRDQPLVAGALAFAVGAAMGSALPHTAQEDALLGDAADKVKAKVGDKASELYDEGRDKAAELYETATDKAGEIYDQAKDGLTKSGAGATQPGY